MRRGKPILVPLPPLMPLQIYGKIGRECDTPQVPIERDQPRGHIPFEPKPYYEKIPKECLPPIKVYDREVCEKPRCVTVERDVYIEKPLTDPPDILLDQVTSAEPLTYGDQARRARREVVPVPYDPPHYAKGQVMGEQGVTIDKPQTTLPYMPHYTMLRRMTDGSMIRGEEIHAPAVKVGGRPVEPRAPEAHEVASALARYAETSPYPNVTVGQAGGGGAAEIERRIYHTTCSPGWMIDFGSDVVLTFGYQPGSFVPPEGGPTPLAPLSSLPFVGGDKVDLTIPTTNPSITYAWYDGPLPTEAVAISDSMTYAVLADLTLQVPSNIVRFQNQAQAINSFGRSLSALHASTLRIDGYPFVTEIPMSQVKMIGSENFFRTRNQPQSPFVGVIPGVVRGTDREVWMAPQFKSTANSGTQIPEVFFPKSGTYDIDFITPTRPNNEFGAYIDEQAWTWPLILCTTIELRTKIAALSLPEFLGEFTTTPTREREPVQEKPSYRPTPEKEFIPEPEKPPFIPESERPPFIPEKGKPPFIPETPFIPEKAPPFIPEQAPPFIPEQAPPFIPEKPPEKPPYYPGIPPYTPTAPPTVPPTVPPTLTPPVLPPVTPPAAPPQPPLVPGEPEQLLPQQQQKPKPGKEKEEKPSKPTEVKKVPPKYKPPKILARQKMVVCYNPKKNVFERTPIGPPIPYPNQ